MLLAFLLTAAAIRMFSKRVGEPLDRLKRGADRLGRGEYDHRIALEGPAEVQGLAVAFNRMAASIGGEPQGARGEGVTRPVDRAR